MPLEVASFISDLVPSNPAHTDGLSQADSQMRLIKSTLKATFPNFTSAALTSTQAALDAAGSQALGTASSVIPLGTAALPGLTPFADPDTGVWSPAANQLAFSLAGTQVLLMGGSALVTSLSIAASTVAASAIAATGAFSGGTGQLVPIGAVLEWYDDTLPAEGGYVWANGQIIANANTVCPILLARWGNKFGGNGTTTMGVPDRRDTAAVGKSTMGSTAARGLIPAGVTLGSLFGAAAVQLTAAQMPSHTHGVIDPGHAHAINVRQTAGAGGTGGLYSTSVDVPTGTSSAITGISLSSAGADQAHSNLQPSTGVNYILRLG